MREEKRSRRWAAVVIPSRVEGLIFLIEMVYDFCTFRIRKGGCYDCPEYLSSRMVCAIRFLRCRIVSRCSSFFFLGRASFVTVSGKENRVIPQNPNIAFRLT
ncbi:MAG: hypothetical protein A2806_04470 [Candidatus Terrybacteria bacterium RIFCSPHIGHO2_01_FULL_48_17]|uniref:Uncharacterized protein n=1 Tax=Candidatus Terrybacteria bacterium RIFCSPHIGHO2_01_FULL_48_17 TaxID=1802362 RepID=A0A1G2PKS3_9BACT|nr:MAG: hypothetical protein A2806_04470 [Candidatus Terrybacteria bacterium RIFCSPHIGHO2_01_FULL_48_17]